MSDPDTGTGTRLADVPPSPSCPDVSAPQQYAVPVTDNAQPNASPSASDSVTRGETCTRVTTVVCPRVAVTVASPILRAVTTPAAETVAIDVSEVVKLTALDVAPPKPVGAATTMASPHATVATSAKPNVISSDDGT